MPALVQHACFTCRKVFKKVFQQESHYPCPSCARTLVMMGTAFRAPKHGDLLQWSKVEQLARAGFLFYRNYGPLPKYLNQVAEFLQAKAREHQSPGQMVLLRLARSAPPSRKTCEGRPKKRFDTEGKARYEVAGRELRSFMTVLVRERNEWFSGTFQSAGNRGVPVQPYIEMKNNKKVFIGQQTMLRWPT